jgi:hypothetical protein
MRQKLLIITLFLIGVVIVLVVLFSAYHSNSSKAPNNQATKISHAEPANFNDVVLTDKGVTSQQLSNAEQALSQFLSSQNKTPNQVSFSSIQRSPTDQNTTTPFSEISFVIQLDGKDAYKAKLDSFSLSEIRLYLYTLDGSKLLYDSQNIGGSSG